MACSNINALLGYEDEVITEKFKHLVNCTTNKIGGKPDWSPNINPEAINCPLCQLPRLLVVQIYAPLENSSFHRTLYVCACINPNCWNQKESWTCIRTQTIATPTDKSASKETTLSSTTSDWCQDADDWGDETNANFNEQNGNVYNAERGSDEDDESYSFEESIRAGFESMSVDDKNANAAQGGAEGRLQSPIATAEIEGDESEVVTIDTPTFPQNDILAMLHESTPLPQDITSKEKRSNLQFLPIFLSVCEEASHTTISNDRHVRELLQDYQKHNDDFLKVDMGIKSEAGGDATLENYEKSAPIHGDKMFHYFLMKIQSNPGQLLRYNRGVTPLLITPIQDIPRKCCYCQGEMVFEFQILPTIIPKLQLIGDMRKSTRVDFGNVLIFTCLKSCWASDAIFRQESIVLQKENF